MSRLPEEEDELPMDLQDSLAAAVQPAELGTGQRSRMRQRIVELAREQAPEGTRTLRAGETAWVEIAPFVEVRELSRDEAAGMHTSLLRMRPGGTIPAHRHEREEEFIVLEGECYIGAHRLVAGDVHIASAGSWHDTVTTESGVVVLLRGEYPHPNPV